MLPLHHQPRDWLRRRDLNPHLLVYETNALVRLSYSAIKLAGLARLERASLRLEDECSGSN